jgi:hypothetical protein
MRVLPASFVAVEGELLMVRGLDVVALVVLLEMVDPVVLGKRFDVEGLERVERIRKSARAAAVAVRTVYDSGGSAEVGLAEVGGECEPTMSIAAASEILGVGVRQVRYMALSLGGRKVGKRWELDRDLVLIEVNRRAMEAA